MVVACHAIPAFNVGAAGVDIFFVISGFVICRISASPQAFLRDRFTRVFPIYYVCSIPWVIVAVVSGLLTPERAAATLTLWPAYGDIVRPALKVGWTLSFELLFYCGMALVLAERRWAWVLICLYGLALWGAFATGWSVLRFVGNPIIMEFGLGVLIARVGGKYPRSGTLAMGAAALAFALMWKVDLTVPQVFDLSAPERVIVWGLPAALMVWGAVQYDGRLWRPLTYLGDASYSIYLVHLFPLLFLTTLPWPVQVVAVIALGLAVHRYVEMPLLSFSRRRRERLALA